MTTPPPLTLHRADPVGAATGWLAGHPGLLELLEDPAWATGPGRKVGPRNAPPFPRLRIADSNADLRGLTGLGWVSLTIDVLGDPSWAPDGHKGRLRELAVATGEALGHMTGEVEVAGCVFTQVTADGIAWAPLAPVNQPRYVLTSTLWNKPARRLL